MTPILEQVIEACEPYFAKYGHHAEVTSGLRTPEEQVNLIKKFAAQHNVGSFKELTKADVDSKGMVDLRYLYFWQRAWSWLLHIGVIVNPPRDAECLFDYWSGGINKRGQIIHASPHFLGKSFDTGGGTDHDPSNEFGILQEAKMNGVGIVTLKLERANNAVHADCA